MNHKTKYGFTLLELLLASAVLTIALCGLLVMFNYCYSLTMQAFHTTIAASGACGKLEEIRYHNYSDIMADYNGTSFSVDGLEPFNGTGTVNISYFPGADSELLQVDISADWQEKGNRALNVSLTSLVVKRY